MDERYLSLGIDIGTLHLGVAVLTSDGNQLVWSTTYHYDKNVQIQDRILQMGDSVYGVVDRHRKTLLCAGIESPWVGPNAATALYLGMAYGAADYIIYKLTGLKPYPVRPAEAKRHFTGHGNATKEEVARTAQLRFGIESPEYLDVTDAMAVAFAVSIVHRQGEQLKIFA